MELSLFHQLDAPTPARFAALRRAATLAESLGLTRIWCLPGTAASGRWAEGAPEIWLAALAGSTQRIRLGWGLAGVWPPAIPPVREAEQAAALDGASVGRLDVALLPEAEDGRGEVEPGDDAEGARMLVDMWATETFSWTSSRFAVPPIDVVPKPLQRPHPPLWLVGWTADHARAAGRAGLAWLDVSGGGPPVWPTHRACYVEARAGVDRFALAGPAVCAVAVDLPDGSELAVEARTGRGGPGRRAWLAELAATGVDAVVLRLGLRADDADECPDEDANDGEAARRIRWLAGADGAAGCEVSNPDVERTAEGEGR